MKIALITPFPPYRGGISKDSENLYSELTKTNDVTVYNFKRLYPDFFFPGTNQFLNQNNYTTNNSIRSIDSINPFSWRKTASRILNNNYDILIFRYWHPFFIIPYNFIIKYIRKKNKDVKIYSICDNAVSHEKFFSQKVLIKSFISKLDGVVVMSDSVKEKIYQINPNIRCKKIFLPILNDLRKKTDIVHARKKINFNLNKKYFLFFGLIREYKGLDIFLSALNKIDKQLINKFKCVIVGENYEDLNKYKKLINKDISKNIIWNTNYINDDDVGLYFSASDFVVLPYKSASQSGIIPMAYYYNKPIIVSSIKGLTELLIEDKTGYSFTNKDSNELKNILEKIITDDYDSIDINEIKRISDSLSTKSYADKLIKFVNE